MVTLWLLSVWLWIGSEAPTPGGRTFAVVVGIADYQALSQNNGDLRFADKDARQIAQFLESQSAGRAETPRIRLLTNQQATLANIHQALAVFREARPGDRVILYFSGHGSAGCFLPYDAQSGDKLLTYGDIKAAFHASKAETKLCIADACLSGGMTQPQKQREMAQSITTGTHNGKNVAMLLASRSTQSAVEAGLLQGGVFTYFLLKGLAGQADLNGDKIVTIRELHRYISPEVRQKSRGRQTPIFYGRFSDNLALSYL
ncbi:hypothetical protein GCM10027347_26040 [Larkinella harenae]